jgi:hypothetical protein
MDSAYRAVLQLDSSCEGMKNPPTGSRFYVSGTGSISLKFWLQEGFSDGIHNDFTTPAWIGVVGTKAVVWRGGHIDDLKIRLKLAAGVGDIETAADLMDVIARLYDMALPPNEESHSLNLVTVSMGILDAKKPTFWFRRYGLMKEVKVDAMRPWDMADGRPMAANVDFSLIPFWPTGLDYNGRSMVYLNGQTMFRPWQWYWD